MACELKAGRQRGSSVALRWLFLGANAGNIVGSLCVWCDCILLKHQETLRDCIHLIPNKGASEQARYIDIYQLLIHFVRTTGRRFQLWVFLDLHKKHYCVDRTVTRLVILIEFYIKQCSCSFVLLTGRKYLAITTKIDLKYFPQLWV